MRTKNPFPRPKSALPCTHRRTFRSQSCGSARTRPPDCGARFPSSVNWLLPGGPFCQHFSLPAPFLPRFAPSLTTPGEAVYRILTIFFPAVAPFTSRSKTLSSASPSPEEFLSHLHFERPHFDFSLLTRLDGLNSGHHRTLSQSFGHGGTSEK